MDKPGLRDALPQPQQSDTRNDPFWGNLDSSLSAAAAAPPQSAQPTAKRDLDVGLGDVARGVGAGALELVGGIGELARQASNFGKENAGKQGGDYLEQARANMANKLSPVLDAVAGAGDLAQGGAESLTEGMSADAKEALGRRLVDETPEGRLTLGDGAGDIDVWAMKMAQGVGSMLPTLAAGGVTGLAAKVSIGRAVTASMIKRGATQEVAEAVAAKAVSKIATGASVTTGVTGSVGSAGVNARDTVLGMSFDELAGSDTFRQAFTRIDQDQQTAHLSDEEKLGLAREETANLASRATMSDAKVWGAAAMGSMMGDAMLFKMLAGKAATGGVLKGAAKGAAGEGISETLEEGVQQYAVNESLNEVAAADIDPMKGVMSSAIEGGLIGMGAGGAVGAVGGARGGKHASQEDGVGTDPVAEPSAPVTEGAAGPAVDPNFASVPLEEGEQAPSASQAEGELNPLGPSASQFDELRDVPAYLRQDDTADRYKGMAADSEVQRALAGEFGQTVQELVASQMKAGDQGKSLYERAQAGELGLDPFAGNKSAQQVAMENQRLALPLKDVIFAGDANAKPKGEAVAAPGDHDDQQAGPGPQFRGGERTRWQSGQEGDVLPPEASSTKPAGELPGAVIEGEAREVGNELPHRNVVYGNDLRAEQQRAADLARRERELNNQPLQIGQSETIFAGGTPGADPRNSAYTPPRLSRDQVDTSMGEQSTRDPRSPVAQSIEQAGSATDSVFGPLKSLRITRKGKPFATEKEAAMASRKGQEMPVPLNGGGFGVAEIAEVEQVKAAATTQSSAPQLDDISVTNPNQPSDQPAASVSAETVPAPSATAGEASQLAPAIDTGYREVIPVKQPKTEVSNEPVTPVPAISSEGQRDQPGAGEPAAAGAGPAVAGLTDRAGSGDRADLAAPAPVPDGQQQDDPTLTAPATDAGAAVSGRIGEEELRDRDLLKEHGGRWKYRSAVGAGWFTANTKEAAIERAEEAYRKAVSKGEPVPTRDERFAQSETMRQGQGVNPPPPRTLDTDGRASDGKPINGGDTFATSSGRTTTPYPKQKGEKYASQWLINNATEEARARGDNFNAPIFSATTTMKNGSLTTADRDGMLSYLFGQQPAVLPPITRPLTAPASAPADGSMVSRITRAMVDKLGALDGATDEHIDLKVGKLLNTMDKTDVLASFPEYQNRHEDIPTYQRFKSASDKITKEWLIDAAKARRDGTEAEPEPTVQESSEASRYDGTPKGRKAYAKRLRLEAGASEIDRNELDRAYSQQKTTAKANTDALDRAIDALERGVRRSEGLEVVDGYKLSSDHVRKMNSEVAADNSIEARRFRSMVDKFLSGNMSAEDTGVFVADYVTLKSRQMAANKLAKPWIKDPIETMIAAYSRVNKEHKEKWLKKRREVYRSTLAKDAEFKEGEFLSWHQTMLASYKGAYDVDYLIPSEEAEFTAHTERLSKITTQAKDAVIDWRQATLHDYLNGTNTLFRGEMDFAEFKAMAEGLLANGKAVLAELNGMKKADVLDTMGYWGSARYKNEKKAEVVQAAYDQLLGNLRWAANGDSNSMSEVVSLGSKAPRLTIDQKVADALAGLTAERYQQFVNKRRADMAKRDAELAVTKEALRDPQTIEQFKTFLKYRSLDKLTPEQRARYEDLIAANNLDKRDQAREVKAATAVTPTASGDIIKTKHTKSGEDLYVVQMGDRVDRDTYNQINAHAKKLGGWYSSYKVGGAVPGFQFKDEAKATEFRGWLTGQGAASAAPSAEATPTEVTEPAQADSKSKQVEALRARANTLRDKATAALNAERKENTNKRMTEAANARANAESELHFAGLLDAIADGIESGEVTYLRNLANGTQLTELNHALSRSLWNLPPARREALTSQGMIERTEDGRERWSAKATPEMMAEGAQMPGMDYFASNLKDVATKMQGASGFKQAGAKIMALVKAAANRDNKTTTLSDPELIAKLKAYVTGSDDYSTSTIKNQIAGYGRLERMGITNHTELRAALRELARLQAGLKKQAVPRYPLAEKMVALKRKLVGNRNAFIDFFPTPESHAADLVALAGIEPGMTVLEPSAGHGMLAEAARAAGAKVDAVELAGDLREILQAKGFGLVGSDFMATTPAQSYDAVVMNPPFSNDMDIDHVRHAYDHLKPGGRLVAIVSATAGDRQNNKNKAFREWFDGLGGSEQAMPEGSFKASLNPTDVRTKIFVIDKPANEAKPLPSPEGKRVTVATPKGQSVEVQYRVMEAADLVASHDFEGNINHDYPQQLQPRDRSKQTYRVQVGQIAAAPDGARLAASPESDRGAPIVRDGIVESGNGRTIGLKQAYQRGDAGAYRAYLLANATEFGLDAAAIEAMSAPVLVRERLTEMDDQQLRDFVVDSNTDAKMANSATEDARADAGKLTTQMLNMLNIPDGGDVLAAQNHRFLQAFLRAIGENQSNSYVNQSGGWNAEYGKRVKAAIFAYGYDNQRLLDAVTGETDEVGRNMIAALLNNAVAMAQLRQHSPDRAKSLANYLAEAVESVVHNKRSGQSLQELAAQGDMLGGGPSTESALLAQAMASNARSAKAMTEMIGDILAMMNKTPSNDMFGEAVTPITAEEAIRETLRAIDAYNQQRNQTPRSSGDLFGLAAARNDHGTTPGVSGHRDGGATESAADQGLKAPKWAKEPEDRHTVAGISFKVPVFDQELQKTFNEAVHRGEGRNFAQEIQTVANRLALDLEADGLLATPDQRVLASQLIEAWVEREVDNAKKTMAYGIANPSWMVTGTSGNPFGKRRQKSNLELENERQADHEKAQEAAVKRMRAALKELQSPEAQRAEAFKLAWRDARAILRDLSSYLTQGKTALLAELRKSGAPKLAKLLGTMAESDPARYRSELRSQDQRFKEAGMPGLIELIGARTNAGKIISDAINGRIRFSKQAMAQGEKPAKHLTRKEAELVTKEWFKQYRGASGIDVQIHATQAELEKALGLAAQDGLIRRAAFDDDSGTLHVAADTIANPKRMREILRHEVLAHYGLANVLGDGEYTKLMSRLIASQKDPSMKPVWDWVNTHYADEDIGTQAEEVVAHLAELEQGAWGRGWDRVVAWVTRALRAVGFVPDGITAAETRVLIESLGKKMKRRGPDDGGPDGDKKFSQEVDLPTEISQDSVGKTLDVRESANKYPTNKK
ncbi:methyltransferase [Aeromonas sp. QDB02]|uniref:methyltransferase n=1 Tax=Aeromonas sp. QDB02 TaxID=2990476 RepID=UPI003FA412D7